MIKKESLRRSGLAACFAIAVAATACGATPEAERDAEATATSSDELAWLAVPVFLTWQEIAAGLVLLGGSLVIANQQFNSAVRESDFANSAALRSYEATVRKENSFIADRYRTSINSRLGVPSYVTPDLWIKQFGYSRQVTGNVATASRQLVRLSNTTRYRGGGCVIATVKNEAGVEHKGGAPFSSSADIIAAQFSAAARAYTRCAKSDPDTIDALKELIPDSPLEATPDTFITYAIKSTNFLLTLRNNCNALSFAVTSDTTACR